MEERKFVNPKEFSLITEFYRPGSDKYFELIETAKKNLTYVKIDPTDTNFSSIVKDQLVTGTGLQQGTYVVSISTNTITISKPLLVQAAGTYSFYNGTNIYKKLKIHGYNLEGTREGGVGLLGAAATATATVS